ncbi:hypothetical protein [Leuconostoc sp. DB-1]|uniref:hypothetical protein n=1 Tax=Leuconostoc sp. DB-1 TaxID=2724526 RepID=UPI00211ECEDF
MTARADPDTKIAPTRLDRGIEQVKALINRIIELTRDILKDPVSNVITAYLPV